MQQVSRRPGKKVAGSVYVHRSALPQSEIPEQLVARALIALPEDWPYEVIRWNTRSGEIAFIQSPDWDTNPEPVVGHLVAVLPDGTLRTRRASFKNPQIYHHKWMFVSEDYTGFDVAASRRRSAEWEALKPDKRRIGYQHYWEEQVLPLL
jgi:hypothetical protein